MIKKRVIPYNRPLIKAIESFCKNCSIGPSDVIVYRGRWLCLQCVCTTIYADGDLKGESRAIRNIYAAWKAGSEKADPNYDPDYDEGIAPFGFDSLSKSMQSTKNLKAFGLAKVKIGGVMPHVDCAICKQAGIEHAEERHKHQAMNFGHGPDNCRQCEDRALKLQSKTITPIRTDEGKRFRIERNCPCPLCTGGGAFETAYRNIPNKTPKFARYVPLFGPKTKKWKQLKAKQKGLMYRNGKPIDKGNFAGYIPSKGT